MRILFAMVLALLFGATLMAEGYKVGDKAMDFKLKNIDGKMVSLADFGQAKGFVVVFTCNHCPFAVAYEDRIVALDKAYKSKGYPVIAINPNDPVAYPADNFEAMQQRATQKGFTFPYLVDETQQIAKTYGATKTPHVYVLKREGTGFTVKYIGTIDDNYQDASEVTVNYLAEALDALIGGSEPNPSETKAIGCSIKWKK